MLRTLLLSLAICASGTAFSQTPPSAGELARYEGLHRAAHDGDLDAIRTLIAEGADLDARDVLQTTGQEMTTGMGRELFQVFRSRVGAADQGGSVLFS